MHVGLRGITCTNMYMHIHKVHVLLYILTCIQVPIIKISSFEPAKTNAFIPHFVGFFGMYCIKLSLPLKAIMLSSTLISFDSV